MREWGESALEAVLSCKRGWWVVAFVGWLLHGQMFKAKSTDVVFLGLGGFPRVWAALLGGCLSVERKQAARLDTIFLAFPLRSSGSQGLALL